jgi:hypothetical protein
VDADEAPLDRALRRAGRRLEAIRAEIEKVDASGLSADAWLLARARIGDRVADFNASVSEVDRLLDTTGAQARILRYLHLRLGEKVSKDELSGVAGIYEWARRVRELRQDHGWAIHSSVTRDDLRVGEYRLESDGPNEDLTRNWATARRIRQLRTSGGVLPARTRVLEFLKEIHPRGADKEQLAHVAGSVRAAADAVEDLRRDGWQLVDARQDGTLAPGECRLGSLEN